MGKAILDFDMIREGDRILVGLSGGKDSLSLLHGLLALQKRAPIRFEIGAVTVDPQTPEYDPSTLIGYMESLGVPYFYESHGRFYLVVLCVCVFVVYWYGIARVVPESVQRIR